jgi:hypothetical protein
MRKLRIEFSAVLVRASGRWDRALADPARYSLPMWTPQSACPGDPNRYSYASEMIIAHPASSFD